jgi:hypothetical protein
MIIHEQLHADQIRNKILSACWLCLYDHQRMEFMRWLILKLFCLPLLLLNWWTDLFLIIKLYRGIWTQGDIFPLFSDVWCRLLCVEHIDKNGKPLLYLVFEYLDTDLKKYIDAHGRGNKNPLPTNIIKVTTEYKSWNTQFNLHWRFGFFCVFLLWKNKFSPVFLWLKMPYTWCGCRASCISCAKELHTVTAMVSCTGMSWIEYRSWLQNVLLDLLPIF